MTVIKQSVLVPYTAAEMYELVNDIEHYPEFLPWCERTEVQSRGDDEVRARIHAKKGGIHHSFSTINRMQKDKMITIRLLEGPFRHLEGFWRFDDIQNQGCRVTFDLEFEFSNKLINLTAGVFLQKTANIFIDAFCERAKIRYGKKQP